MQNLVPASESRQAPLSLGAPASPAAPARLRYVDAIEVDSAEDAGSEGFLEYWQILSRHKGVLLVGCFLGALLGLLFSLPQTPIYRASTTLEIEPLNENYLNLRDVNPTSSAGGYALETDIATQVKVLESTALMETVVRKLNLDQRAEFQYSPGRLGAWRQALGLPAAQPLSPFEKASDRSAQSLEIRPSRKSRIVEIYSEWPDPQLSADFANTLAESYIEHNLQARWESTQRTGEWLRRQLEDLRIKLEQSAERLQQYARSSGLMFTSEQGSVAEERLRQLQAELSKAQADRIASQSRLELAMVSPPESLPQILGGSTLRDYQIRITDLRRGLASVSATFTPAHPKVQQVKAEIAEVEAALERERKFVVERIRNEYQSGLRRESLLEGDYRNQARLVSKQAERAIQYNILKGEVETNRQLYDTLLQKVKEAGVASAMRASNIRVVDPARPPRTPYRPAHLLNAVLGLISGALLAIGWVFVGERADRTLKQPGDAAQHLSLPELGVIPASTADPQQRAKNSKALKPAAVRKKPWVTTIRAAEGGLELPAAQHHRHEVGLISWHRKTTLTAECFRAAVTSIVFASPKGGPSSTIVVTSPSPGEGKTTVTSNIGICLAEIKGRVLLIDADMRRPRMHQIFNLSNRRGLSDLLRDNGPLDREALQAFTQETEVSGLDILPSGSGSHDIPNLLHSARAGDLLRQAEEEYAAVLIDTPPMLQISDARVLGQMAGAVVLVLRAGQTTRSSAKAAADRFLEDGTRVLGTVLNSWDPKTNGYGYYDSYNRYGSYYSDPSQRKSA